MSLLELPIEVTLRLISDIDAIKDRVALSAINKSFRQLIDSTDFIINCKTLYTFTRNISDHELSFRGNLLRNVCRYFDNGTSNQTSEEILQSLLVTNNYDFKSVNQAVKLCHTLGYLTPLKIMYQFIQSSLDNKIKPAKTILKNSLINNLYFSRLFHDYEDFKLNLCQSLYHEHYQITHWLIEINPVEVWTQRFMKHVSHTIVFHLLLNDRLDSVKYLLQIKSQYELPILLYDDALRYLFDECGSTYRTSEKYYDLMQILYNHIKSTIPKGFSDKINRNCLMTLCHNGHTYYLNFLLKIIIEHQMWNQLQLITFIKEGFVAGCVGGHFELVETIYKGCTQEPLEYGVKVNFADCLKTAYGECLKMLNICVPIGSEHSKIIRYFYRLSRQPGYIPINISHEDIPIISKIDFKSQIERLVIHNIYI